MFKETVEVLCLRFVLLCFFVSYQNKKNYHGKQQETDLKLY